jgi:hypothetical protein
VSGLVPERTRDPRVRALLASLEAWLPAPLAWERAMNAAAPLVLLESIQGLVIDDWEGETRAAIAGALTHASAMRGHVATREDLERAIDAWLRSSREG